MEGETISKYWLALSKEKRPRDIIYALEKMNPAYPDQPKRVTRSDEMAELARNYHNDLQREGDDGEIEDMRAAITATNSVLGNVDKALTEDAKAEVGSMFTRSETRAALRKSENNKAAGIDGLPYELSEIYTA